MKESIGNRVGRLLAGSVNALIDAVENVAPEMVMEQALREIDNAIDEVRAELGKLLASKHLASKRLMEENRRHEELATQIEVAVAQAREDLAEAAIARQFDIEAQLPVLQATIADAAERQKELESYIAALHARRREMESELSDYLAAQRRLSSDATARPGAEDSNGDVARRVGQAESAFNRVLNRATGVPGSMGLSGDASKLAELEELARKNRIKERLEQIKAKQG